MPKARTWSVFIDDKPHPLRVEARSAAEATEIAKSLVRGERFFPHRDCCKCEEIETPCVLGQMESRLQGTPLGKVCRL